MTDKHKLECFSIFQTRTDQGVFAISTENEDPNAFWVEIYGLHDNIERAILLKVKKETLKELSEVLQAYCS